MQGKTGGKVEKKYLVYDLFWGIIEQWKSPVLAALSFRLFDIAESKIADHLESYLPLLFLHEILYSFKNFRLVWIS